MSATQHHMHWTAGTGRRPQAFYKPVILSPRWFWFSPAASNVFRWADLLPARKKVENGRKRTAKKQVAK